MAVKENPPNGLLDSFSAPLWARLGLNALRAVWIVRGKHRGFDWMAIELDHGGTGFQQSSATTTVFVVWLPRKSKDWYLPAHRIRPDHQVCVDDTCLYAAVLAQQPPVRTWARWLDLAVDAAEEVISTEGMRRNESPQQKAQRADEASWNPTDIHLVVLCLVAMAFFSFLSVMMLIEAHGEWQRHGAILVCQPKTSMGTYLQGWKAVVYAVSLAAPLPIALKALHTMVTRVYRPAFFLQLCFEGLIWVGLMYGLYHVRQALVESVQRAC